MTVLAIREFGDPILRAKAKEVTVFDATLARLAHDLSESMHAAPGVGLAAPQVGVSTRLFVYDSGEGGEAGALCNPEITWFGDVREEGEEGCLSIPGIYLPVDRAVEVRLSAQLLDASPVEKHASGLLARIFQHEIDHLNGILFVDHLADHHRRDAMRILREREMGINTAPVRSPQQAL